MEEELNATDRYSKFVEVTQEANKTVFLLVPRRRRDDTANNPRMPEL